MSDITSTCKMNEFDNFFHIKPARKCASPPVSSPLVGYRQKRCRSRQSPTLTSRLVYDTGGNTACGPIHTYLTERYHIVIVAISIRSDPVVTYFLAVTKRRIICGGGDTAKEQALYIHCTLNADSNYPPRILQRGETRGDELHPLLARKHESFVSDIATLCVPM